MSSRKFAAPLQLDPRPSRRLATLALLVYGGALAAMAALALPWWAVAGITSAVLTAFVRFLREHVLRADPHAVLKLVWDRDGQWTLVTARGVAKAALIPPGVVYPELVILRFRRAPGGPRGRRRTTVLLLSDSLDRRTFRRLRMRLEMEAARRGDRR